MERNRADSETSDRKWQPSLLAPSLLPPCSLLAPILPFHLFTGGKDRRRSSSFQISSSKFSSQTFFSFWIYFLFRFDPKSEIRRHQVSDMDKEQVIPTASFYSRLINSSIYTLNSGKRNFFLLQRYSENRNFFDSQLIGNQMELNKNYT